MKIVLQGLLNVDEYDLLCLSTDIKHERLADALESHLDDKIGQLISVNYFITNQEVTLEECKMALIHKVCGGSLDKIQFILEAYSEWTIIEKEEHFVVGGHDLITELKTYDGKYVTLVIEDRVGKISSILE
jgi:hypothetical protein